MIREVLERLGDARIEQGDCWSGERRSCAVRPRLASWALRQVGGQQRDQEVQDVISDHHTEYLELSRRHRCVRHAGACKRVRAVGDVDAASSCHTLAIAIRLLGGPGQWGLRTKWGVDVQQKLAGSSKQAHVVASSTRLPPTVKGRAAGTVQVTCAHTHMHIHTCTHHISCTIPASPLAFPRTDATRAMAQRLQRGVVHV